MDSNEDFDPIKLIKLVETQIAEELEKKGRIPPELTVIKEKLEIFNEMADLLNTTNPLAIYAIPEKMNSAIIAKKRALKNLSKEQLINKLAELEVRNDAVEFTSNMDQGLLARLLSGVNEFHSKKIENSGSKTIGRAKLYEGNERVLEEMFINFEIKFQRKPSLDDYSLYERLVFELHPTPPYIPEKRVYRKKEMTPEQIAEEKRDFKRTTWSKGYIRSFFEKKLGGKVIKMKKKSSLK